MPEEIQKQEETPKEETQEVAAPSAAEKQDGPDKPEGGTQPAPASVPFHQDPKVKDYIARQLNKHSQELEKNFNARLASEAERIRNETAAGNKPKTPPKIPSWFGGDQEQWEDYNAHLRSLVEEGRAGAVQDVSKQSSEKERQQEEATAYFRSEIEAIQDDPSFNPSGEAISKEVQQQLVKIAEENDLIDSKGRWNWKAAWRFMAAQNGQPKPAAQPETPPANDRKDLAAATGSDPAPERKKPAFASSDTFKSGGARPW